MICPDCIHTVNLIAERGSFVYDELKEVVGRRLSSQKLELLPDGA